MTPAFDPGERSPVVGDEAPDVELPGATPTDAPRLRDLRGTPVVLAFYPGHEDAQWAEQVRVQDAAGGEAGALARRGVRLYGIAVADHPEIAGRFGVGSDGAVIVVDEAGRVSHREPAPDERGAGGARRTAWSRREFVRMAVAAAVGLTLARSTAAAEQLAKRPGAGPEAERPMPLTLEVNGRSIALDLDTRVTLLDALRDHAGMTGPKKGCDHGQCGACTVHVGGRRVLSCLTLAVMAQGKPITTVEGLARDGTLHPLQRAFIEHDGFQCGYCTSGQLMSAAGMLEEPWGASDDEVREAMSGNICRCGAYPGIVAAIQQVRAVRGAEQ